jgi:hypothetical protein
MKTILILEDNDERIAAFQKAVAALENNFELKIWRDAPSMIAECEPFFPTTALISLDHDLNPMPGAKVDPGTGLDVAKFLAECRPVCPLIIHSTNADRAHSMHNELRFADWIAERVGPIGTGWIETMWLRKAREFLAAHPNTWPARLPADHVKRMQRTLLSLDGLSVGDGFGECFFTSPLVIETRLEHQDPPPPPWFVTDDSMMAVSIARCLKRYGHIDHDARQASRGNTSAIRGGVTVGQPMESCEPLAREPLGKRRQAGCSMARARVEMVERCDPHRSVLISPMI